MVLFNFLESGESIALMMSVPLSYLLGKLYQMFSFPWMSLLYAFTLLLIAYIFSFYAKTITSRRVKTAFFSVLYCVFFYLIRLSINTLTCLTMISAVLLYCSSKYKFFLFVLIYSWFLRVDIFFVFFCPLFCLFFSETRWPSKWNILWIASVVLSI